MLIFISPGSPWSTGLPLHCATSNNIQEMFGIIINPSHPKPAGLGCSQYAKLLKQATTRDCSTWKEDEVEAMWVARPHHPKTQHITRARHDGIWVLPLAPCAIGPDPWSTEDMWHYDSSHTGKWLKLETEVLRPQTTPVLHTPTNICWLLPALPWPFHWHLGILPSPRSMCKVDTI